MVREKSAAVSASAALVGAVLVVLGTIGLGQVPTATADEAESVYESPSEVQVIEPKLTPRPDPLRDFPVEQVLDVTDFGAAADDNENDVAGIRAAIKQAAEARISTEVRFPKGRYYLDADIETDEYAKFTNNALAMLKAERVILNGNGSEIIIRTPPTGFLTMAACKDVIVRDFVVDWDPPPFAQGFVRAVDRKAGTFDFEVEPGFVLMDHPLWKRPNRKGYDSIRWGMLKDPNILIEGNTFVNWRNQAISLGCTENAIIRDNRFLGNADGPAGVDDKPHIPIRVHNATRVSVRGNHIQDARPLVPGAVEVAGDCEDVDVRGNTLRRTP